MRIAVPTSLCFLLALAHASGAADRPLGREFTMRSPTIATHGMVASEHPLASRIGVEILEAGGTAVDAAIAVNAALGFMEPTSCGVGGDLFAIVWDAKTQRLYGLNGSGRGSAFSVNVTRRLPVMCPPPEVARAPPWSRRGPPKTR